MPNETANSTDPVKKPHSWDKAVSAAYLRLLGNSQEASARSAGISPRSLVSWETCSWWPQAKQEAKERWLNDLVAKARVSIEAGVQDDPNLALKILERLDLDLRPPKERMDVSVEGGVLAVPQGIEEEDWGDYLRRQRMFTATGERGGNGKRGGNGRGGA